MNPKKIFLSLITSLLITNLSIASNTISINEKLYNAVIDKNNNKVIHLDTIKTCLQNKADPNWHNGKRSILSHYLWRVSWVVERNPRIRIDGTKALKLLFQYGAKIPKNDCILYLPIVNDWGEAVELLLQNGATATKWNCAHVGTPMTPIQVAYSVGNFDIAKVLLKYGAKKEKREEIIQLQFLEACGMPGMPGAVSEIKKLYQKGAKINKAMNKQTPLILAIGDFLFSSESFDKIYFLLDNGADVNQPGERRFQDTTTALHQAISGYGLLINQKISQRHKNISLQYKNLIKKLLDIGAYVSAKDYFDQTPLHIAVINSDVFSVKLLIEYNAKLMPKDYNGRTPLDFAKSGEIIKLLKDAGAFEL